VHQAEAGIWIALATAAGAVVKALVQSHYLRRKAMLRAETETHGHHTTVTVRAIDDTAAFRQELWVRCEKLEGQLAEAHRELLEERHKYLELLRDHLALQTRYEEVQREVGGLKETVGRLLREGMQ
jgi:hypothetical protein